jgi:enoyl-CoA hydratase/carnithine racemase
MNTTIEIRKLGAVALLRVADFSPLSRHDPGFALELRDAVRDAADEDSVKAIVLTATGSDFCPAPSAGDLQVAARQRSGAHRRAWQAAYAAPTGLWQNLAYCRKFVVGAVQGHCGPAGSQLVLCSDFTVCRDDSRFDAPFASLPESSLVLAALTLRLNRAKSWMLGGEAWSAEQAVSAGLVNRAVGGEQLLAQALAAAHSAARMPLDGVAMSKIVMEAFLDTQGVGQDFDMAELYADAMQAVFPDTGQAVTSHGSHA